MATIAAAAYGMYSRNVALPEVVGALNKAGFQNEDICMVLSPAHPDAEVFHGTASVDFTQVGATSARTISWFTEFGAVVIPTVGVFIRSYAFFQALLDEQNCPSLSRGSRTLLGLGFSQADAKRLGHRLTDIGALVYVSCHDSKKSGAVELFRSTGAQEASTLTQQQLHSTAAA